MTKEMDEMRGKIAQRQFELQCPHLDWDRMDNFGDAGSVRSAWLREADQILSLVINGYTIEEMVEFFAKIDQSTQRAAVVKKEAELPDENKNHTWYKDDYGEAGRMGYKLGQQDMLSAGFVQEVEKDG